MTNWPLAFSLRGLVVRTSALHAEIVLPPDVQIAEVMLQLCRGFDPLRE